MDEEQRQKNPQLRDDVLRATKGRDEAGIAPGGSPHPEPGGSISPVQPPPGARRFVAAPPEGMPETAGSERWFQPDQTWVHLPPTTFTTTEDGMYIRVSDRDGSISTPQPPIGTAANWAIIQDAIATALPAEWSESAIQDALEQVRSTLLGEGMVLIEKRSRRDAIAAKDPVLLALSAVIEGAQHAAETRITELCSLLDRDEQTWAEQHQPPAAMRRQIHFPPDSAEPKGVSSVMTAPTDGEENQPPPRIFNHIQQEGESLWEDVADLAAKRYTWGQLNHTVVDGPFGPLTLQAVAFEQE